FLPPPPSAISPLSLHDALPISAPVPMLPPRVRELRRPQQQRRAFRRPPRVALPVRDEPRPRRPPAVARERPRARLRQVPPRHVLDRKSTRLNSSHDQISYAVFC